MEWKVGFPGRRLGTEIDVQTTGKGLIDDSELLVRAVQDATVPRDSLESLEVVGESLYDALGAARPVRVLQRLRAVLFTPEQSQLLGIEPGSAGLEIQRRGFAADGRTVEFTKSYYGDAYDFVAELNLARG